MIDRAESVYTIKPTPRIERLKEAFVKLKITASLDRACIETRVMKETEGEPMLTRRAKVFAAIAREMPIDIYADELLVGFISVRPWCNNITPADGPELEAGWSFYDTVGAEHAGSNLTDEENRILNEELIPYWKGADGKYERTREGRNLQNIPKELAEIIFMDPDSYPPRDTQIYSRSMGMHYGHNCPNYQKVLSKGFLGIKKDAEERLSKLDLSQPGEIKKELFLKGVIIAMQAASELGTRFAAKARSMAEKEDDITRQKELLEIAKVCDWVPANPPRTFYEALQAYFFTWILLLWETSWTWSFSIGRADQYLYPFYEKDIKEGRITKEDAQELVDCFIIKLNQLIQYTHVSVGGFKADGSDATNELSLMFIEAMMHTRLVEPVFGVLIHSKTPDTLLIKACQLCSMGSGHPQFINNDVLIEQALARGTMGGQNITLQDARAAAPFGCSELGIPGRDSGYYYFGLCNLAAGMEFVLTNGFSLHFKRKMGLETGDPRKFKSIEEVREAYRKQIDFMRKNISTFGNIAEQSIAELSPTLYESALIDDCIEKGICREEGGAHYNFNTGLVAAGTADVADSLAAIKKLVFDEKKITMDQLCDALEHNFEGYEDIRQMLLNAPKYGNDDDYVDMEAAFVSHVYASEMTKIRNTRGGYMCPGGSPLAQYVVLGEVLGALPSGRLAGKPLADAWSPFAGVDMEGPTAVLNSMGKIDHVEILGGVVTNLRIDPVVFKDSDGIRRLANMLRTFIDLKIFEVQINVVSSETLKAAQKEPEKYRGLVVKVAGYNAFFVQLSKTLQDSIIARTEHGI